MPTWKTFNIILQQIWQLNLHIVHAHMQINTWYTYFITQIAQKMFKQLRRYYQYWIWVLRKKLAAICTMYLQNLIYNVQTCRNLNCEDHNIYAENKILVKLVLVTKFTNVSLLFVQYMYMNVPGMYKWRGINIALLAPEGHSFFNYQ